MPSYRFSPSLAIERFADEAILFVAERDVLVTINHSAADLFEGALTAAAGRAFGRAEAIAWLESTFDLPTEEVKPRMLPLLAFAIRQGIVVKQSVQE